MVLELPADDPEGGVDEVVIDVDLGEPVAGARRHPLLVEVVVNHDGGARGRDALLGACLAGKENNKKDVKNCVLERRSMLGLTV